MLAGDGVSGGEAAGSRPPPDRSLLRWRAHGVEVLVAVNKVEARPVFQRWFFKNKIGAIFLPSFSVLVLALC